MASSVYNDPNDLDYDPSRRIVSKVGGQRAMAGISVPSRTPSDSTLATVLGIGYFGGEGSSESISEPPVLPVMPPARTTDTDLYPMQQPQGYSGAEIFPAFAFMAPPDLSYDFKRGAAWGGVVGFLLGVLISVMALRGRRR